MFDGWKRERKIRFVLRGLARQRVVGVFQPGNVLVIELSPVVDEKVEAALETCKLRGWVEIIEKAMPKGRLTPNGKLPPGNLYDRVEPVYRLTESGWNVINRTHTWLVVTCIVAVATLIATMIGIIITCR